MKINKIKIILVIGLIAAVFLWLRLYRIEERMNFSMDQGIFLLKSWDIFQNKEITLLGPTASPVVHNHQFFQGPLIYYSLILLMLVSNWNVIAASYFLVFFNFLSLLVLYIAVKKIFDKKVAAITAIIYIFLPVSINFSNFIWNPNFLLILTPFFIYLGTKSFFSKKWWNYLIWGIMGGICLQFHFQFGLILLLTFLFLVFKKQNWKNIALFVMGAGIGYSPLVFFDLRNNFYNLRTILEWLKYGGDEKFLFQTHYFLSFVPFICIEMALFLNKLKNRLVLVFVLLALGVYSTGLIINQNGTSKRTNGWNYPIQEEVINKILNNGCPKNFNIASTVSGDTRSYDLRFLLTTRSCFPMNVEEYPKAEKLFLVAPIDRPPETETVWEVSSLGKFRINRREKLTEKIVFYELESLEKKK